MIVLLLPYRSTQETSHPLEIQNELLLKSENHRKSQLAPYRCNRRV